MKIQWIAAAMSDEEARRMLLEATKRFPEINEEINKLVDYYINEQLHELTEKNEELKRLISNNEWLPHCYDCDSLNTDSED